MPRGPTRWELPQPEHPLQEVSEQGPLHRDALAHLRRFRQLHGDGKFGRRGGEEMHHLFAGSPDLELLPVLEHACRGEDHALQGQGDLSGLPLERASGNLWSAHPELQDLSQHRTQRLPSRRTRRQRALLALSARFKAPAGALHQFPLHGDRCQEPRRRDVRVLPEVPSSCSSEQNRVSECSRRIYCRLPYLQVVGASHVASRERHCAAGPEKQAQPSRSVEKGCRKNPNGELHQGRGAGYSLQDRKREADHPLQQDSSEESSEGLERGHRERARS